MHFLNLTLRIRFEPVLGGLGQFLYMRHYINPNPFKEIAPYTCMQMVRSNKNNIIYSNSMKTNRNELIRRLLSEVTADELENLVRVREEASNSRPKKNGGQAINPLF